MVRIKICRVNDVETARALGCLGVEFIGLHLVAKPSRERLCKLAEIISSCSGVENMPKPVMVVKNLSAEQLCEAVRELKPPYVQLHDEWSPEALTSFRESFPDGTKIVLVVDPISGANAWLSGHGNLADYVLLDRIRGGTGNPLPPQDIAEAKRKYPKYPIFLAGGLNPNNVASAIEAFAPFAVDVQSALEVPGFKGRKDISKVIAFVKAVRGESSRVVTFRNDVAILCLSLTDHPLETMNQIEPSIVDSCDVVHLDHANSSVDTRFVRNSLDHARRLHDSFAMKCYDLHLFVSELSPETVEENISSYLDANPFMRALLCYLDPHENLHKIETLRACVETAQARGIKFAFSFQARELTNSVVGLLTRIIEGTEVKDFSIVGPADNAGLERYVSIVGPFIRKLQEFLPEQRGVIVDRSVSLVRLRALENGNLGGAVAGKSIWASRSPHEAIAEFRKILRYEKIS